MPLVPSMETLLKPTFPIFSKDPNTFSTRSMKPIKVSIKPPPSNFDFTKSEIQEESRAAIEKSCPELLDLANKGNLVLIEKRLFGPVPPWRTEFVEPGGIWLLGTNHVSSESAEEVARVVKAVKPDNVVVELCRSRQSYIYRAGIMYISNEDKIGREIRSSGFSLSGTGFFGAVGRSLNLGGQTALALRLLLALFSSKISSDINRPFGDEFRAARKVSEEVGAQIVLGDRPIEITLARAWKSLKWREKLNLLITVIRGITSSSNVSRNNFKKTSSEEDGTLQLYEQLSFSYPSLLQPLLHERDIYLAWSLKRSKAVNKSKRVVGVVGRGHLNGIIYALISDQGNLRFRDLVGRSPAGDGTSEGGGIVGGLIKSLIRDTILGILLWILYEQIKSVL